MKSSLVFPGQGAQFVGMAADLIDADDYKSLFENANTIFKAVTNQEVDLLDVMLNGPEDLLKNTAVTQPAIVSMSMALASKVKEAIKAGKLNKPEFVAGHSLGEFAALYMADVLDFESTIKLIVVRGNLMASAPAGAMAAIVGIDKEKLQEIINPIDNVSVANYNSPDQIVITGTMDAVAKANTDIEAFIKETEIRAKVIPLVVSGAFHSPLMADAAAEFAKLIDETQFADASIPIIQNFTAQSYTSAIDIKENLKKQMTGAVQWTDTVQTLIEFSDEIIEIGPGKVLAGLVKKQSRRFPVKSIATAVDLSNIIETASV